MSDGSPVPPPLIGLEDQVQEALVRGEDIQELVRQLTLRKISDFAQDLASLKMISETIIRGAKIGLAKELVQPMAQAEVARKHLTAAVSGLDNALGQFALASRLALEEAVGRSRACSAEELAYLAEDMANLDVMLLDVVRNAAVSSQGTARVILQDLVSHLSTQETFVGTQAKETLSVLTHQAVQTGRAHLEAGQHLSLDTVRFLRKFAAGALSGISERIIPNQKPE